MNIGTKLSLYCALAITVVTGSSEIFQQLFSANQPLVLISVATVMTSGLLTFVVTSIMWKFLVFHRLQNILDQITILGLGRPSEVQKSWPLDEFGEISAKLGDLRSQLTAIARRDSETKGASGVTLLAHRAFRRIILVTEHISSVLLILRIAQEYNQPISSGAIHNLTLIEKDLHCLQKEFQDQFTQQLSTTSTPVQTDISRSSGIDLSHDRTQAGSDGRFRAPALRIVSSNVEGPAKT